MLLILLVIVFSLLKPDTFLDLLQHPLHPQQQVGAGAWWRCRSSSRWPPISSISRPASTSASRRCWRSACRGRACRGGLRSVAVLLMGALVGLGERPPGHPGEDRFLHRHARHRHDSLRAQRLVHRRPAGARPTCRPSSCAISGSIWIVPAPAIYALVVSLVLWVVFEFLPLGRYLYVLGASPRAAELNGISAKRYVTLAFVAAGTLASFAGIVLQSQLQVGQSSVGQEYLLPAFTAALLGATSIRPGPRQCLGHGAGRGGAGGDGRRPQPARRAVLRRAAVQRLDADPRRRPCGAGVAAPHRGAGTRGRPGGGRAGRARRRTAAGSCADEQPTQAPRAARRQPGSRRRLVHRRAGAPRTSAATAT